MARKTNRVFDTKQEDIDNILQENKELMEDFINYLEATDHSNASIKVYMSNLNIFFVYLLKHCKNKDFVNIKKKDILLFQNYMLKNGLGTARIKNIRSSISSLGNYIESMLSDEEEKWEDFRNIVNKIPAPNGEAVREKTILSDGECQEILDWLVSEKMYDYSAMFSLGWASGRRKQELLRIKKSWITDDNLKYGSLYKTPEKVVSKGRGSQGKMLYFYILKQKFKPYFDLWMEERKRLGIPDEIDDMFVVKRDGEWKPATISTLDYLAEKISNKFNINFYFHCLRHQFTTSLSQAKIPANIIKDIIGWESVEMCSRYDDSTIDDQLGDYFNENGVKDDVESGSLNKL